MTRKKFFKKDLKRIERIIHIIPWKMEITRIGKQMIREGIRIDYDKTKESLDGYRVRLKAEREAKEQNKENIRTASDNVTKLESDVKYFEEQMETLDKEIKEVDTMEATQIESARAYRELLIKLLNE